MEHRSGLLNVFIYSLLVLGLVVFGFPFIYTVGSSMKVDRELYAPGIRVTPTSPNPSVKSPFVDTTYFDVLPGAAADEARLMPTMLALIDSSGFVTPDNVDKEKTRIQLARGLFKRLANKLPRDTWEGSPDNILSAAKAVTNVGEVESIFREIHRYFGIGSIRVRSTNLVEKELSKEISPDKRWTLTSGSAALVPAVDDAKAFGRLDYDFADSKDIKLVGEFDLPFPATDLQRLRVDLHPDDTWHTYTLMLEHQGKLYKSERSRPVANFDWFTQTWQFPSADDDSTKLRLWTVLQEDGTSNVTGEKIRITLLLSQSTPAQAWYEKIKLNYTRVFEQIPFWRYVQVSVFLVIANIVLTLLSSSLVAYAFSRIQWPGRDFCFLLMLATMMIPPQVMMIPHFVIWKTAGAFDTLTPLWLGSAFGSAFFVFLLRQSMKGIPRDLEDAGRIDGLGFLGIYWHVILPLVKPGLAAIAIFTFMGTWNNFMGPLIYVADQRLYPLAFGLYAFNVQVNNNASLVLAGSVMMTVPVILIFFFAQRYFVQGVTLTGVKG